MRPLSKLAPDWWDYTTLDPKLLADAAQLDERNNPFGIRLSALLISERLPDTSVPMSLLADPPNVHFHYLRPGLGKVQVEMH